MAAPSGRSATAGGTARAPGAGAGRSGTARVRTDRVWGRCRHAADPAPRPPPAEWLQTLVRPGLTRRRPGRLRGCGRPPRRVGACRRPELLSRTARRPPRLGPGPAVQGDDPAGEVAPGDVGPAGGLHPRRPAPAAAARPGSTPPGRRRPPGCCSPRGRSAAAPASGTRCRRCGTAATPGWRTRRPPACRPGRVTRENSRSAARGSATLRRPKEITTPSTLSSASGSAIASPATLGTGRAAPARSIPWEKSQAIACTPPAASSTVDTAVPAATSSTVDPGRAPSASRGGPPPAGVQSAGEHGVGDVVAAGDPVEHRRDLGRALVQPGPHPRRLGSVHRSPRRRRYLRGLLPWSGDHGSPRPPPATDAAAVTTVPRRSAPHGRCSPCCPPRGRWPGSAAARAWSAGARPTGWR